MTHADRIIAFLRSLDPGALRAPKDVTALNPYSDKKIWGYCKRFYKKYYSDNRPRAMLAGINPGRFGGGLTGIPFTDPVNLQEVCGIRNDLVKRTELSGDFIYRVIDAYGGAEAFYKRFYFTSVVPMGFTRTGKNMNYYDTRELREAVTPFVEKAFRQQLDMGFEKRIVYCLGMGKNVRFLRDLNRRCGFFGRIVALPHPRFVMQYRRKSIDEYIDLYIDRLGGPTER